MITVITNEGWRVALEPDCELGVIRYTIEQRRAGQLGPKPALQVSGRLDAEEAYDLGTHLAREGRALLPSRVWNVWNASKGEYVLDQWQATRRNALLGVRDILPPELSVGGALAALGTLVVAFAEQGRHYLDKKTLEAKDFETRRVAP